MGLSVEDLRLIHRCAAQSPFWASAVARMFEALQAQGKGTEEELMKWLNSVAREGGNFNQAIKKIKLGHDSYV
ncbi:MAG: hypothetical protein NVS2B14_00270 [Chamaesiphon sp.]